MLKLQKNFTFALIFLYYNFVLVTLLLSRKITSMESFIVVAWANFKNISAILVLPEVNGN